MRSRGVAENALVHEVEKWKEGRVFQSMPRRYPLSAIDIAKAYNSHPDKALKKGIGKDEMGSKAKEPDFAGPPPPGYLCNRCGKKG